MAGMSESDYRAYLARTGLTVPTAAPVKAQQPRTGGKAGQKAEQALCGWLDILGIEYAAQYPWGAYLTPPRKFRADLAILPARLIVEVVGGAHIAGKERLNRDIERTRLLAHAGWALLTYTPGEAQDGTASLDIQKYLATR